MAGWGFPFEVLTDPSVSFNFAITGLGQPVHIMGQEEESPFVLAMSAVRLTDEDYAVFCKMPTKQRISILARLKQLVVLRGVQYRLVKDDESDAEYRGIYLIQPVYKPSLSESTLWRAVEDVRGAAVLAITVIEENA